MGGPRTNNIQFRSAESVWKSQIQSVTPAIIIIITVTVIENDTPTKQPLRTHAGCKARHLTAPHPFPALPPRLEGFQSGGAIEAPRPQSGNMLESEKTNNDLDLGGCAHAQSRLLLRS